MIRKNFFFMTLGLVIMTFALGLVAEPTDLVTKLTPSNFDSFILSQPYSLIKFYIPTCKACKRLQPTFEAVSIKLKTITKLGEIDCSDETSRPLCLKYKVEFYPTLVGFNQSLDPKDIINYDDNGDHDSSEVEDNSDGDDKYIMGINTNGSKTVDGIVRHIISHLQPPITIIDNDGDFDDFKSLKSGLKLLVKATKDSPVVQMITKLAQKGLKKMVSIGIINPQNDITGAPSDLITLARRDDNVSIVMGVNGIGRMSNLTPSTETEINNIPSISTFNPLDETTLNNVTPKALKKFLITHSLPIFGEVTPTNLKTYIATKLPLVWVFIDPKNTSHDQVIKALTPFAQRSAGKLVFVRVDGVKWIKHAKSFGIPGGATPGIVIEHPIHKKRFIFPHNNKTKQGEEENKVATRHTIVDFTTDNVIEWITAYFKGDVDPYLKSQPLEEEQLNAPIQKWVSSNFEKLLYETYKHHDVFLKTHTISCGHCRQLAPKYEELADLYVADKIDENGEKNKKKVIFAEIDLGLNDLPSPYDKMIYGYPTLILFKAVPFDYKDKENVQAIEVEKDKKKDDKNYHKSLTDYDQDVVNYRIKNTKLYRDDRNVEAMKWFVDHHRSSMTPLGKPVDARATFLKTINNDNHTQSSTSSTSTASLSRNQHHNTDGDKCTSISCNHNSATDDNHDEL